MLRFLWFAFPMLFYVPILFAFGYFASMAAGVEKTRAKYIGIACGLGPFPLHVIYSIFGW